MKLKLFIATLLLMISTTSAMAEPYKADAKTRQLPAGTKLQLQLIDPINTVSGSQGDSFSAMLMKDQMDGSTVVLPAGSVLRGCISKVKPVRRLSRGAVLYLTFDHVVTPNGRQLPLTLTIYNQAKITNDGGLYTSKGYGEAMQKSWVSTKDITVNATEYGSDLGDRMFPGATFITTPICALGGIFGSSAYYAGSSVANLFKKGDDVILNQGTILDTMLAYPIDVPLN